MRATSGPVALIASHIPLGPALIVAISFAFGCAPSKRTYEERTSDGTLTRDGQLAGDVQVGPWTYHYPDGRKKAEGRFRDDHQDGLWTYWYENGAKEMEGSFAAERRTGLWRYWHPNGSLRAEGRFENDREAGRWIFYRPDGTLDRSGAFRDGARVGRWTYYDTSGDPRASGHYIEDRKVGPWRFWNAQGRISERSAPLPDECVLVFERGQGSFVRREGLIANGRPMGRWETRHRDGETRMAGDMADGVPDGIWEAFAPDGKLIAFGPVARGRMVGAWTIVSATGKSSALEAEGIRAPAHVRGEWSSDSLFRERAPAAALASWLAEAAAPLEPDADEDPFMPVAGLSPIEFADDEPGAPTVHVQPALTVSQAQNLERIVEGYTSGGLAYDGPSHLPAVSFQAGGPDYSERESRRRLPPGDEELARSYLGKPLPEELLLDPQGKPVDLSSFRGRENILLVILRGFDGRVCEYCAGQTMALGRSRQDFAARDTAVIAVYPGRRSRLDAFLEAYRNQFGTSPPRFLFTYDPELGLANSLGIGPPEGKIARPTILLLDKTGVVRYAYVGNRKEDRPSVDRLLAEIDRLQGSTARTDTSADTSAGAIAAADGA